MSEAGTAFLVLSFFYIIVGVGFTILVARRKIIFGGAVAVLIVLVCMELIWIIWTICLAGPNDSGRDNGPVAFGWVAIAICGFCALFISSERHTQMKRNTPRSQRTWPGGHDGH
jgi:hypothetical protein